MHIVSWNVNGIRACFNKGKFFEFIDAHHPDILFGWGYAKIKITTHAIKGLSENDFILAAKIDKIINV